MQDVNMQWHKQTASLMYTAYDVMYSFNSTSMYQQEDTVLYFAAIHSSLRVKLQMNELPKSTWVVVVDSLCITKGFHDRAKHRKENAVFETLQIDK